MEWSPQQSDALKKIQNWLNNKRGPQIFRLFGFAGVGKTTLAREVESMTDKVLYATFTGKAALVLRRKGCEGATTIHSLIYKVKINPITKKPEFTINQDSELRRARVLVLDEVSMVGEELAKDLLSFGVKILALGDPFQLPPVKDSGYFTNAKPDHLLTEIHRQAKDNPIIRMSMDIREGKTLEYGQYGESRVIPRSALGQRRVLAADQVLCGLNNSRRSFNMKLRSMKGIESPDPVVGDRLVCLRNNREKALLNGGLWTVESIASTRPVVDMIVRPDDEAPPTRVEVPIQFFQGRENDLSWQEKLGMDQFDFGYALTVHKSQGSQWNDIVLFDESQSFRDDAARWLYTGVTRAASRIDVVK